jgi:hypothetical protein
MKGGGMIAKSENSCVHRHRREQLLGQSVLAVMEIPASLENIRERLDGIQVQLGAYEVRLDELQQSMRAFYERDSLLADAGERMAALTREHHCEHIVKPLVRQIAVAIDLVDDLESRGQCQRHHETIRNELFELLSHYGVVPIEAEFGTQFDARWMQPCKSIPTNNHGWHNRVHKVIRRGYRLDDAVLRHALVQVCRFEQAGQICQIAPQFQGVHS